MFAMIYRFYLCSDENDALIRRLFSTLLNLKALLNLKRLIS